MVAATTNYGAWKTHTGTLAEVMGAIKGKSREYVVSFDYDEDNNLYFAICYGS